MNPYIHPPFALALLIAVAWTTLFSLASTPGVRGWRNVGILGSYVLALVFLFIAGWRSALATWAVFGISGGVVYILWEILQRLRAPADWEKPGISLSPLVHGLLAWPIMVPEAVEHALAEAGILPPPPPPEDSSTDVPAVATGQDEGEAGTLP
jgi:hypothetical protein